VVACGTRSSAFKRFCSEFARIGKDDVVLLLVDSEAPLHGDSVWAHGATEGAATKETKSGSYDKGAHSFRPLAEIDPAKLQAVSPSARRLFDALRRAAAD
jgi:hypothetical protein